MKSVRVYICESSIDGIFTAIYEAWSSGYGHKHIRILEKESFQETELFTEYVEVVTENGKAGKVADAILSKISRPAYELVCRSAISCVEGRADAIYRFLLLGFSIGSSIIDNISHPLVHPLFQMDRAVRNEAHHYLGFLRFSQLDNGIFFGRIRPKHNILSLIGNHFAQRLADENWVIYDEGRQIVIIHQTGKSWFMTDAHDLNLEVVEEYSQKELEMQKIWKKFVEAISIKERENKKLQSNMMPNRYREFMREVPYMSK